MSYYISNSEDGLRIYATIKDTVGITYIRSIDLDTTVKEGFCESNGIRFPMSNVTSVTVDPIPYILDGVTFTGEGCLLALIGWLEGAKPFLKGLVDYSDT